MRKEFYRNLEQREIKPIDIKSDMRYIIGNTAGSPAMQGSAFFFGAYAPLFEAVPEYSPSAPAAGIAWNDYH